jgi:hypothetical protein
VTVTPQRTERSARRRWSTFFTAGLPAATS